jgi:hypothetical protein
MLPINGSEGNVQENIKHTTSECFDLTFDVLAHGREDVQHRVLDCDVM